MKATANSILLQVLLAVSLNILFLGTVVASSTISGTVYDKQRNPLPDITVELLNDYYQMIRTPVRTDGTGRYQFDGLRDGRYTIHVYAFRYDLEDQSEAIEINTQNIRGGEGTGFFLQDFYLVPKRGGLVESEIGVVFVQEVPAAAKKLYETAVKDLSSKRLEQGVTGLYEAVKVFPEYYDALHRLGKELFIAGNYQQAYLYFLKAAEVNPKSATSLYYLGCALHNLGYNKAAATALTKAQELAPASPQISYILGKVERAEGKFQDAEKHLLQAKKLSKVSVAEIHKELAQLYANDLKKYTEAADELEEYLKASKLSSEDSKVIKKKIDELRQKAKNGATKT